jgi:hypothetical protein
VPRRLLAVSNCWICEGWSEQEFVFVPKEKFDDSIIPVKLHLQAEDYVGELIENKTLPNSK